MTDQTAKSDLPPDAWAQVFAFFTEVGIINQLSTTLLGKVLPEGVHPSHFFIVQHLVRTGDGKTPISIARAMQVTKNTMTHSLRVLTDHGFILVGPNPDDARGKLVYLTDAGRSFHSTAIAAVLDRFGSMFNDQHVQTMARLLPDLAALRKHLDDNR